MNEEFHERTPREIAEELHRRFPEHSKYQKFYAEIEMVKMFVNQYLPSRRAMIATADEGGILMPLLSDDGSLIGNFFGIDTDKFEAEKPALYAFEHELTSENSLRHPDPELATQIAEFESLLSEGSEQ